MEPQQFYFFSSFRELLSKIRRNDICSRDFQSYLMRKHPKSPELVKILAELLLCRIIKPQRLLLDHPDYYVAVDMYTHTYYICYRQLLMLDIDFYKDGQNRTVDILLQQLETYANNKSLRFTIYRTRNGLHVFIINKTFDYTSDEAMQIMLEMEVDFNYIIYSYLRGWSVRLNRKQGETSKQLYTYIKDVGAAKSCMDLRKYVKMHIDMCRLFSQEASCLMYAG